MKRPGPRAGQKLDRKRNDHIDRLVLAVIADLQPEPAYQRIVEEIHERGERASHHEVEKSLRRLYQRAQIKATGKTWEVRGA